MSDGTRIPGNRLLSQADRTGRFAGIHRPFHEAIAAMLDERAAAARPAVLVAVHSFTPELGGVRRPWLLGALCNRDPSFAGAFLRAFAMRNPGIDVALNRPYTVDDLSDYTIPVHGERRGLPHVLVEVRSDQIEERTGQADWAQLLAEALADAADTMEGHA